MNGHVFLFAFCVSTIFICGSTNADETTTPFSLDNLINNVKSSELGKTVQNQLKDFNVETLQQNIKNFGESVRPVFEKGISELKASGILEKMQGGIGPLLGTFNTTSPATGSN
jgi:hypothetical protein